MQEQLQEDPVPTPIQDLLTVFKKDLSTISFPDVNKEILDSLATDVRTRAKELEQILASAVVAREALETSHNELLQKASRGLAYAKVFAENDDHIMEKLTKINLGKSVRIQRKTSGEKTADEENIPEKKSRAKKVIEPKPEDAATVSPDV
jgi:hypothetical protein